MKHRIIPVLLVKDGQLVKGEKFQSWRTVGHPLQAAKIHEMRGVDELIVLDIGATPNNTLIDTHLVEELTRDCYMPLTVGGGIKTLEDIGCLLRAGADKVSVCTAAIEDEIEDENVIEQAILKHGSQAVVVSIDVGSRHSKECVFAQCGQYSWYGSAVLWSKRAEDSGAGEILLNSIELDGTMGGYDIDLISRVSSAVKIPVIACGGASSPENCAEAIRAGASAVAVGALFQFTDVTPKDVAAHFVEQNIPVRI